MSQVEFGSVNKPQPCGLSSNQYLIQIPEELFFIIDHIVLQFPISLVSDVNIKPKLFAFVYIWGHIIETEGVCVTPAKGEFSRMI